MNKIEKLELALNEAKALLREEVNASENDREHERACCPGCKFQRVNHFLPPSHPAWKHEPAHSCWVGRAEKLLKDSNI